MDMVTLFPKACLLAAVVLLVPAAVARDLPSVSSDALGSGRYARMQMLLEKTFLQVDVARVVMRFGKETERRIAALARGRGYSDALASRIARAAVDADHAVVELTFERDASFDTWLKGVRKNLGRAYGADLIDEATYRRVYHQLPEWFEVLKSRGFEDGDRLLYRVRPASLRTVVVSEGGQVLFDRTDRGNSPPRVLLAGYFAPGNDFREPLIESLFAE